MVGPCPYKAQTVVRFHHEVPHNLSVGKSGLIHLVWDQDIVGSNPTTETKFYNLLGIGVVVAHRILIPIV